MKSPTLATWPSLQECVRRRFLGPAEFGSAVARRLRTPSALLFNLAVVGLAAGGLGDTEARIRYRERRFLSPEATPSSLRRAARLLAALRARQARLPVRPRASQ